MAPSDLVRATNAAFPKSCCCDWEESADFEAADRGLIAALPDLVIRDREGRIVWDSRPYDAFLQGSAPATVNPSLWRLARLNNKRGLYRVTDGVYQVRGHSLANITFVRGTRGYIVIDPNNTVEVARFALELLYAQVEEAPVTAVIYSHSHSDHWGGVKGVTTEADVRAGKTKVIASKGFAEFVLRESVFASEGLGPRNGYMYGESLPAGPCGHVDCGLGKATEAGTVSYIAPTDIIGGDGGTLKVDGVTLAVQYAPGEAPTGMHVYLPEARTLHIADNCYASLHNVYTIRGAMNRDALQWADSVDRARAFGDPEILIGGHHWPCFGRERVKAYLEKQRDALKYQHDQTLRLMNHGYTAAEIAAILELPPSLAREWNLRGYYGAVGHNVRGIYAFYLGWYDGNPATLDPLPPRDSAGKFIEYMGGLEAVLDRARRDYEAGRYRWVVQVLDLVLWLDPDHGAARLLAAAAYRQLGYMSENATWRNAYLSAAQELSQGRPEGTAPVRDYGEIIENLSPAALFSVFSIRLNGPKAFGAELDLVWEIHDLEESHAMSLRNAVLHIRPGDLETCDARISLDRRALGQIAMGRARLDRLASEGRLRVQGRRSAVDRLFGLLDQFDDWFPIASHGTKFGERRSGADAEVARRD